MILRRFMKHVTDQNWFAVGLDVLVVIAGIFWVFRMRGARIVPLGVTHAIII